MKEAFRRRPVDADEFKQQRAETEAEAERNRKRSGQSASFASLYGTKVRRVCLLGVDERTAWLPSYRHPA